MKIQFFPRSPARARPCSLFQLFWKALRQFLRSAGYYVLVWPTTQVKTFMDFWLKNPYSKCDLPLTAHSPVLALKELVFMSSQDESRWQDYDKFYLHGKSMPGHLRQISSSYSITGIKI